MFTETKQSDSESFQQCILPCFLIQIQIHRHCRRCLATATHYATPPTPPPETLIQIFNYQWSKFAHTACFRHFNVTQKTLRRLLSPPCVESSLPLVKDSMEIMDLYLKGFEDWNPTPLSRHDSQAANMTTWNGAHGLAVRAGWTIELNNDLHYLATIIKQSRKLHILRIRATIELHPLFHLLERRDYLFLSTIHNFLSATNLTSLELDLSGTRLVSDQQQEHDEGLHICTDIAALLPTLQCLRLRMRNICADVLKLCQQGTKLRLSEVLINLSLSKESPLTTSATHATCCIPNSGGFLQLKADMEEQARILVAQMSDPKIVRILTHTLPKFEMRAFDVLTGKTVRLSEDAEWDADGEAVEDEVSDEESEISDLSSDDEE
ncbi:hypothetical protein J1614_002772 [Plenodomus biglobosus]|nr:hypothetical protein J1614_002772 [Plenodomus biglobosus]